MPTHLPTMRQRTSLSVTLTKSSWTGVRRRTAAYAPISALPELVPSSSRPIRSLPHLDRSSQTNPAPMMTVPADPSDSVTYQGNQ